MHKRSIVMVAMVACSFTLRLGASAGTLDTTFSPTGSPSGTVTTPIGSSSGAQSIAIQEDGTIVAAGVSDFQFALARYTTDGSLDTTFGVSGIEITSIGSNAQINGIALQKDSAIVAAGFSDGQVAVARYTTHGSLDTTFGVGGIVITPLPTSSQAQANAVVIQPDGKIVVVGQAFIGSGNEFVVIRYTPDGNLDTSFNGTGIVITPLNDAVATAVVLQPNGSIVVAGYAVPSGSQEFAVVRYTSTGSLDTSFNGTGVVFTSLDGQALAFGVALQQNGKIVVAGQLGTPTAIVVARFTSSGALDTTFNGTGIAIVTSDVGAGFAVVIQQNGKIVVAGKSAEGGDTIRFLVARFNLDGSLDTSFNPEGDFPGIVITLVGGNDFSFCTAVALQTDGKIVVAGNALTEVSSFGLARYIGDPVVVYNACTQALINKYGL